MSSECSHSLVHLSVIFHMTTIILDRLPYSGSVALSIKFSLPCSFHIRWKSSATPNDIIFWPSASRSYKKIATTLCVYTDMTTLTHCYQSINHVYLSSCRQTKNKQNQNSEMAARKATGASKLVTHNKLVNICWYEKKRTNLLKNTPHKTQYSKRARNRRKEKTEREREKERERGGEIYREQTAE